MEDHEIRDELRRLDATFQGSMAQLESRISSTFKDALASLKVDVTEMRRRQTERDEACAGEKERNRGRDKTIEGLCDTLDSLDTCSRCKNDSRLMRIETYLNILLWVSSALVATTFGTVVKAVVDYVAKK